MSSFSKKMEKTSMQIGNRKIDSDEALGVNFKELNNMVVAEIKIDALIENPYQPRSSMDLEELNELKESIEQRGLLQPILVCPSLENPKQFQIIAGHRRTSAMKLLGRETIPALILKDHSEDLRIDSLIENIQRVDLSPIDEAFAVKEIIDFSKMKQIDVAKMLGKSKSYISQLIKITSLPISIIEKQKNGNFLSLSLLSEISYISDQEIQEKVYLIVCDKKLNKEETRSLIAKLSKKDEKIKKSNIQKHFTYQKNSKRVSFKLNLTDQKACQDAIKQLEELLKQLKEIKV